MCTRMCMKKGQRPGQSIQWHLRPEPAARAVVLTFSLFNITNPSTDISVDIHLGATGPAWSDFALAHANWGFSAGNSTRGERIFAFHRANPPEIDHAYLIGDTSRGTQGSVIVHFQTSSEVHSIHGKTTSCELNCCSHRINLSLFCSGIITPLGVCVAGAII